jgi:hypothetical protein
MRRPNYLAAQVIPAWLRVWRARAIRPAKRARPVPKVLP